MATRRVRMWAIGGAVVGTIIVGVLVSLPFVVRHLAVLRLERLTGRPVTVRDVDLNLVTRHLVFRDVVIHSPADAAPLAKASRIDVRFRLLPLLTGRIHLHDLLLVDPAVVVVRRPPDRVNIEDVVAHWRARSPGEPVRAVIERVRVERGRITLADYGVDPDRRWIVENFTLEARDIATTQDAAAGRASARFVVAGARAAVEVSDLSVRPFHARVSVRLDDLDLSPVAAYLPGDAGLRVARGRLDARATLEYGAGGVLRGSAESTIRNLALLRRGQVDPLVMVPAATVTARDVTYAQADVAGDLAISVPEAVVLDAGAPRPRPLSIRDVQVTFGQGAVAGSGPGRLAIAANLPGNGTLAVKGTAGIDPLKTDVTVDVRGLDLALATVWLPSGTSVVPTAGEVGATLDVRYAEGTGLSIGGRSWIDGLALAPPEVAAPFLEDDRVDVTAAGLTVGEKGVALGHLAVVASPTVVPRAGAAPLTLESVRVTADGGRRPGGEPARIDARIALPYDGHIAIQGDARLDAARASFVVAARGVDVRLARAYLPRHAALTVQQGRLDAQLTAAFTGLLEVDGRIAAHHVAIARAGQGPPLVEHATLEADVTDLRVGRGGLSLDRLAITGAPVILDASVSPAERFEMRHVELVARDVTWPARRPMQLAGRAEAVDGGRATLRGTLRPDTVDADVRLEFEGVALARATSYLPDALPLAIQSGRVRGAVEFHYARGAPVRMAGAGTLVDVSAIAANTRVVDDRIAFRFDDVVAGDGGVTVGAAVVDASPVLGHGGETAEAVGVHVEIRKLTWPGGTPAELTLALSSGDGRLDVHGTIGLSNRRLDVSIRSRNLALAPLGVLLPIDAVVAGTLDASARVVLQPGGSPGLAVHGDLAVQDVRIGSPVRAAAVRVEGLAVEGHSVQVAQLTVAGPTLLIEREKDGSFPLRAMFAAESGVAAPPGPPADTSPRDDSADAPSWRFTVEGARITEGSVRFVDRRTTPFYSEEATALEVRIRNLTNVGDARATVRVEAIVGTDAALDLRGELAPFGSPFFLEVSGTLRDFAVTRTNPYLRRFLDWIARRGQLTTEVHYRIVGDELRGTNEIHVRQLDVHRAPDEDRTERLVGVPLGLAVALMKDAKGHIRFTLPVSGDLKSPTFSFGDAIRSALSRVLGRLVTAPLRAIGSVFRHREGRDAVDIEPVTFEPGSAALSPDAAAHLQRVADVLRASPYVSVRLAGVAAERDLQALRTQRVIARIQHAQRTEQLADFGEAARQVWRASMPSGSRPPDDLDGLVRVLTAREPSPSSAARELAERRERVARRELEDAAGIPRERLADDPGPPVVDAAGAGRVEFTLQPAS